MVTVLGGIFYCSLTNQFELRWMNIQLLSVGILPVPGPEQWLVMLIITEDS